MAVASAATATAKEEKSVTLKMNAATLEQFFAEIERQTGVDVRYDAELIATKKKIDVSGTRIPLHTLLNHILPDLGLRYTYKDNIVDVSASTTDPTRGTRARTWPVSGRVADSKGQPLPGATVIITGNGSSRGTTCDTQGNFTIESHVKEGSMQVSFVGYKAKTLKFTSGTSVSVKLEDDNFIDEVTVIGYGVRKKRQVVGAISTVKFDDLKDAPAPSLDAMLQGRVAGMSVIQQSGAPGSGATTMAIRGYNSIMDDEAGYKNTGAPLYVIDGVPVHSFTSPVTGTNTIAEIDPTTIESVEVCKDAASAAIYGSRAANGVILITTKKGREGRATFSANVSYSIAELPVAPDQLGGRMERIHYINMATATREAYYDKASGSYRYPTSYEESAQNGAIFDLFWNRGQGMSANPLVQDSLNSFYNNSTNWYKYIFRKGKVVNANIQASG